MVFHLGVSIRTIGFVHTVCVGVRTGNFTGILIVGLFGGIGFVGIRCGALNGGILGVGESGVIDATTVGMLIRCGAFVGGFKGCVLVGSRSGAFVGTFTGAEVGGFTGAFVNGDLVTTVKLSVTCFPFSPR